MNHRNRDLLDLARLAPRCMCCGKPNEGDVVAMHSNSHIHGKGAMLKAHDHWIAFGCSSCHMRIDQGSESRAERLALWTRAHIATMDWVWSAGLLCVSTEHVREDRPEPIKRRVKKSRPMQSRGFRKDVVRKMDGTISRKEEETA